MICHRERNSSTKLSSLFPSRTLVEFRPLIAMVGPAYILFTLCCIQCNEVQHMRDIPPTVPEEQLSVQVIPYHLHNSVNLPRHLLHSTLHMLLWCDGSGHLHSNLDNSLPCLIPFEQRNVIDNGGDGMPWVGTSCEGFCNRVRNPLWPTPPMVRDLRRQFMLVDGAENTCMCQWGGCHGAGVGAVVQLLKLCSYAYLG